MERDTYDLLTLALMYHTSWKEKYAEEGWSRTWIGFDFDALNRLEERELISGKHGNKSKWITPEGAELAKKVLDAIESDLEPALERMTSEND